MLQKPKPQGGLTGSPWECAWLVDMRGQKHCLFDVCWGWSTVNPGWEQRRNAAAGAAEAGTIKISEQLCFPLTTSMRT